MRIVIKLTTQCRLRQLIRPSPRISLTFTRPRPRISLIVPILGGVEYIICLYRPCGRPFSLDRFTCTHVKRSHKCCSERKMNKFRPSKGGNRHRIVGELLPSFEKTAETGFLTHYKNFRAADLWAPTHPSWYGTFLFRSPCRKSTFPNSSVPVTGRSYHEHCSRVVRAKRVSRLCGARVCTLPAVGHSPADHLLHQHCHLETSDHGALTTSLLLVRKGQYTHLSSGRKCSSAFATPCTLSAPLAQPTSCLTNSPRLRRAAQPLI